MSLPKHMIKKIETQLVDIRELRNQMNILKAQVKEIEAQLHAAYFAENKKFETIIVRGTYRPTKTEWIDKKALFENNKEIHDKFYRCTESFWIDAR